jgi:RNA polymerase sigma factor (sigma-70 family)
MTASEGRPLAGLHDVELARLAAAGGRAAFGELARRHSGAVRALLRRMGAEPALADDLAQDAFLAAYERIGEFRGEGAFVAWVKAIAARLYVKRWRRRGRLDPVGELTEAIAGASEGESAAARQIDLDEALRSLSRSERICVSLCYGGGLSHSEIAEALKAPLGTVKSHMRRGLEKLRTRLGAAAETTPVMEGRHHG